ncbi:hypothetical protein SDC9_158108 [bioreactor metagenome]|uniref:Uncharacterized protein n=1 Tax=bioreactor metagenome TaxID=1076179 RepID=A0A645F933_9ZZZZ
MQLELVERHRAKEQAVEKRQVNPRVEDVRSNAHRFRRSVAVGKITCVCRDCGIEAACDILIERHLQTSDHVKDQLPCGSRLLHIVDVGIAVVGAVVIDVERSACCAKKRGAAPCPCQIGAVHANNRLGRACLLRRYKLIRKRKKAINRRDGVFADHLCVFAKLQQSAVKRKAAAERVAIRGDVRNQQNIIVRPQKPDGVLQHARHSSPSSVCASSSFMESSLL